MDVIVCDICRYSADDGASSHLIKIDKKEYLVHNICWTNAKELVREYDDYQDYLTTTGDY